MKKTIAIVASILLITLSLFGCNNENSEDSKIEEHENEIAKLELQLNSTNSDNELLSKEIEDLENEIADLKNPDVDIEKREVKDDIYLTLKRDVYDAPNTTLSITYEDSTEVEIILIN